MIRVNEQVSVRRQMRNGTLIRIGSVLSINAEAGTAVVHFPVDQTSASFPVEQLEPTSRRFGGRARVQAVPFKRGIA